MPLILLSSHINIATLLNLTVVGASVDVGFYVTSVRYSLDIRGISDSSAVSVIASDFPNVDAPYKNTIEHTSPTPMTGKLTAVDLFGTEATHSTGITLTSQVRTLDIGVELSHSL